MQLSIISFTENGKRLSEKIAGMLGGKIQMGHVKMKVCLYTKCKACISDDSYLSVLYVEMPVGEWAGKQMQEKNAILFIGACGIAVRAVAPFLTDKMHDPPVLVMDEKGGYIIPVLSGHMGGANELADHIAAQTGAEPVITTATDVNKKFAVDLFAKDNGLYIANRDGIVKVSSKVLAGKEVTISIQPEYKAIAEKICGGEQESGGSKECASMGVRLVPYPPAGFVDIVVTAKDDVADASILLRPREYIIGIGCKKGKCINEIDGFIAENLDRLGISVTQVAALSSISQKHDEKGIVEWCRKEGIPFLTYTAQELQEVEGDFTASAFVKAQVGVDNVCERAALKACGKHGKLIAPKYAGNGMTIAVAKKGRRYEE